MRWSQDSAAERDWVSRDSGTFGSGGGGKLSFLCSERDMQAWEGKLGNDLVITRCRRMDQHTLKAF